MKPGDKIKIITDFFVGGYIRGDVTTVKLYKDNKQLFIPPKSYPSSDEGWYVYNIQINKLFILIQNKKKLKIRLP